MFTSPGSRANRSRAITKEITGLTSANGPTLRNAPTGELLLNATSRSAVGTAGTNFPVVQSHSAISTIGAMLAGFFWSNNAAGPSNNLAKSRGTSVGSHALVNASDTLGAFVFYGDDGTNFVPAAQMFAAADGTPATNAMAGRLVFSTNAGGTTMTERMRIDSLGSVSIGNNSSALGTTATDGFLYIPTCAGAPTGVPTTHTGTVAIVYDTTNNKFWIYNGAWKGGTTPGAWT